MMMYCIRRRVRACTRLSEAAKAPTTRDHVRGIGGSYTPLNKDKGSSGDQRCTDDAERWGETVGTADGTDGAERLYEPRNTAYSQ
jgi:hypothetical protein